VRDGWVQHFGYGPWFRVGADGVPVFLQKEGINVGTSCVLRHYPGRDVTVVILSNLEQGAWDPLGVVHEMVMAGAFA
jgi:hypothetical protein